MDKVNNLINLDWHTTCTLPVRKDANVVKMVVCSIALTLEQVSALARLHERDGIGRSEAVRRALDPYLRERGVSQSEEPKGKPPRKR